MQTKVLRFSKDAIDQAAALIRDGQLVAFPTETVYGLGANALDPDAVGRIFAAKGRPGDNPLIVHIADVSELRPLIACDPGDAAKRLIREFWPGPLTMIFPKSDIVPKDVTAGLDTVAVRFPLHTVAWELIRTAGVPIAAPSANRSSRPSPTIAAHVLEDMEGRIPLILDGGECAIGLESTVVDMTGDVPHILRPGEITAEEIADVVGGCEVDSAVMRPLMEGEQPRSPGMKHRHYAPVGELTVYTGDPARVTAAISGMYDRAAAAGRRPLILALEPHRAAYGERRTESLGGGACEMAHRMFGLLRRADALGADVLFSEAVEAQGIGLAVMNRLSRAAAFHIVEV